jgi:hypothetical protein
MVYQEIISMIKRIWLIITYPFTLLYHIFLFPFKVGYLILSDKKGRKMRTSPNADFDIHQVGYLLFPDLNRKFDEFLVLYATDKVSFQKQYQELKGNNMELSPLELIQSFGSINQRLGLTDWKGEENELEIQDFIDKQVPQTIIWKISDALRKSVTLDKQRDGIFIMQLLQAIDLDLQSTNVRLLFLNLDWDAYVFLPVTTGTFDKIFKMAHHHFKNVFEL